MKLGICWSPRLLELMSIPNNPDGHPENPSRIQTVYQVLEALQDRFVTIDYTPQMYDFYLTPYYICQTLIKSILGEQILYGYAVIRPPSHHSLTSSIESTNYQMFCGLNCVALWANELAQKYQVGILDCDIHFSGGTYQLVKDNPRITLVDIYGALYDKTIVNTNPEMHLLQVDNRKQWIEAVKKSKHLLQHCEFLLISLGFDFLENEADGVDIKITDLDYVIDVFRDKKTLLCLEGGYNLDNLREGQRYLLQHL